MAKIVLHPINKLFVLFMQTILEFCPDPRVTNIVPALAGAKEVLLTNVFSKVSNHLLQNGDEICMATIQSLDEATKAIRNLDPEVVTFLLSDTLDAHFTNQLTGPDGLFAGMELYIHEVPDGYRVEYRYAPSQWPSAEAFEYDAYAITLDCYPVYGQEADTTVLKFEVYNSAMPDHPVVASISARYTPPSEREYQDPIANAQRFRDQKVAPVKIEHPCNSTFWLLQGRFDILYSEHGPWSVQTVTSVDSVSGFSTLTPKASAKRRSLKFVKIAQENNHWRSTTSADTPLPGLLKNVSDPAAAPLDEQGKRLNEIFNNALKGDVAFNGRQAVDSAGAQFYSAFAEMNRAKSGCGQCPNKAKG